MENVSDALKMGGAALLFVIAFSITMILFSQCKSTADVVMSNLQINNFMRGVNGVSKNITRKVGLETVIPTIYRYGNQDASLRVIIKGPESTGGTVLQVFDIGLEKDVSLAIGNTGTDYNDYLLAQFDNPSLPAYMFQVPWVDDRAKILERINNYITGCDPLLLTNKESTFNVKYNHSLLSYASSISTYNETYTEYRTSGKILIDEYDEEIVLQQPSGTFKIITYQQVTTY